MLGAAHRVEHTHVPLGIAHASSAGLQDFDGVFTWSR